MCLLGNVGFIEEKNGRDGEIRTLDLLTPSGSAVSKRRKSAPHSGTANIGCNWGVVQPCSTRKTSRHTRRHTGYSSPRNSLIAALITHALAVSRTTITSLQLSILHPSWLRVCGDKPLLCLHLPLKLKEPLKLDRQTELSLQDFHRLL